MKARPNFTEEQKADLKRSLAYDPDTGWVWRLRKGQRSNRAGCTRDESGYRRASFQSGGKTILTLEHRLAYYLMGETPPLIVDHINGDKSDNRWCNLRRSSSKHNNLNRIGRAPRMHPELPTGVYRRPFKSGNGFSYYGQIRTQGKLLRCGSMELQSVASWVADTRSKLLHQYGQES